MTLYVSTPNYTGFFESSATLCKSMITQIDATDEHTNLATPGTSFLCDTRYDQGRYFNWKHTIDFY